VILTNVLIILFVK